MAVAGWVCSLAAMLSLTFTMAHNHSVEPDTYHVSAGHLFVLKCLSSGAHSNVTWSGGDGHSLNLPTGVEVREGLLWFLPVQMFHNGSYTCERRAETKIVRLTSGVSVSGGECPAASETVTITQGVSGGLPCKQTEIFKLNGTKTIRWMKDCRPVQPISVADDGFMRLPAVSEKDAGKYTCLVDVSVGGRKYTTARSIQMTVTNDTVAADPQVVFPRNEVVIVEVGMPVELKCLAFVGSIEDDDFLMYWIVDEAYTEDHEELTESWKFIKKKGRVYGLSILSISKVHHQFLNVPIHCYVRSSTGQSYGLVQLQEGDYSVLYTTLALCLTASLTLLVLGVVFFFFKLDVVLAYRELLRHFPTRKAPDGKLYDGYVSFLNSKNVRSTQLASFALEILPEELEKKHGYSLYIRGRDDSPGEAYHDIAASTIHQCRRMIIILSPDTTYSADNGKREEVLSICDDQIQMCYEQKIGLYDTLIQNDPRIILVEIDGPLDYSRLPESLRYIRRRQGALKWKTDSVRTNKLTKWCSTRNFWKKLRYHMPSVPARSAQIV